MDYNKEFRLENIKYFCEFDLVWKTEEWNDVVDYEGIYKVSDLGRVKSLSRNISNGKKSFYLSKEKILKPKIGRGGYLYVILYSSIIVKTIKIHQIVAISFLNHKQIGHKLVVNHKNFIRTDNRKLNLNIITARENTNKKHIKSSSQYVGVCWYNNANKWRARIDIMGTRKSLGMFINEIDAHNAYQKALSEIK